MASKENVISISKFEKVLKDTSQRMNTVWHDIDVEVEYNISFKSMLEFVNNVVETCFGSGGEYLPEVLDFAVRCNVLTRYANFKLPNNLEARYMLVYGTDAFAMVCGLINQEQLDNIKQSINDKICYRRDMSIEGVQSRIDKLVSQFEVASDKFSEMFGGIAPQDFNKIMSVIGESGAIDEEKIVKAFIENKGV